MIKIMLFLVTVFIFSFTNAQEQKKVKEYYNHVSVNEKGDSKIKTIGQIDKNGFAIGEWEHYSENGILEYKVNHTTYISQKYYTTGELEEKGTFNPDSGAHIGKWTSFYKNGKIKTVGINDEDGEKDGVYKSYLENGTLESTETFKKGIKQG